MAFDFLGGYWWVKKCRYIQRYCDQRPSFLLTRSQFSRRSVGFRSIELVHGYAPAPSMRFPDR